LAILLGLELILFRFVEFWGGGSVYGEELRDFEVHVNPPLLPLLTNLGSLEFGLNQTRVPP
jgi:hypothetical protein